MVNLFDPIRIGGKKLMNRIVVSPMCQFAAIDGVGGAWHMQHLGGLALSGAGLLILESSAVSEQGRISKGCLGLYRDRHTESLKRLVSDLGSFSDVVLGIQLAHAGRKGSVRLPWEGESPLALEEGGWPTIGPSPLSFGHRTAPREATAADLEGILDDYVAAARRAVAAGFSVIELHAAHGYLLHQFLSPLTNHRRDAYGGDANRRMRFPLDVFRAVREAVPSELALGVRVSGSDWHVDGAGIDDAERFASELADNGADYLCASSGGIVPGAKVNVGPGYQVPFAERIRLGAGIPVMAVGMIDDAHVADDLIASGKADIVALARPFLDDPRWGVRAARQLGVAVPYPLRYQAVAPQHWARSGPAGRMPSVAGADRSRIVAT